MVTRRRPWKRLQGTLISRLRSKSSKSWLEAQGLRSRRLWCSAAARPDPATLVGGGKLDEIEGVVASTNADVVLFDHDLSPSQLRNLDARLPAV